MPDPTEVSDPEVTEGLMASRSNASEEQGDHGSGAPVRPNEDTDPPADAGASTEPPAESAEPVLLNTPAAPVSEVRRPVRPAALRKELDEKAAQTDELREALDELRQVLDFEPAAVPASPRQRRNAVLLGTAVIVVLCALLAFILVRPGDTIVAPTSAPSSSDAVEPTPLASQVVPPPATAVASDSAPSGTPGPATTAMAWPGGPLLTPPDAARQGPGVDAPGTDALVALDPDRTHVDVYERFRLTDAADGALTVNAPRASGGLAARATVENLQVELDGVPAVLNRASGTSFTATPASGRYTTGTLRYRVSGAVVTLEPSAAGRALVVVGPLSAARSGAADQPVVVHADGPQVVGVSCPGPDSAATVCGTRTATGWSARIPAGPNPVAVLQVNLDPA